MRKRSKSKKVVIKSKKKMGEIPIRINKSMTVFTDDPKKIPAIRKQFKKYADEKYIKEQDVYKNRVEGIKDIDMDNARNIKNIREDVKNINGNEEEDF